MIRKSFVLTALVCLGVAGTPSAAVYKWVDDKGVTHYTATPPPEGTEATKIKTPRASPAVEATPSQESPAPSAADPASESDDPQEAQFKKVRAENCAAARKNLSTLQNRAYGRYMDASGKVTRLSDEERARLTKEAEVLVKDNCD